MQFAIPGNLQKKTKMQKLPKTMVSGSRLTRVAWENEENIDFKTQN